MASRRTCENSMACACVRSASRLRYFCLKTSMAWSFSRRTATRIEWHFCSRLRISDSCIFQRAKAAAYHHEARARVFRLGVGLRVEGLGEG